MNICIIGSGGREAAIAWKIIQSPECDNLYFNPGNGGTVEFGQNIALDLRSLAEFSSFLKREQIDMLIVGPEAPLVEGLVDRLKKDPSLKELMIVGPSSDGAMLEGSKSFAKEFMQEFDIPTAAYRSFHADELPDALRFIQEMEGPYVLKADGLAAGKGVLILEGREEAIAQTKALLGGQFGKASERIVIEEFLRGIEFSVFVVTDGTDYQLLPVAKDYKRRGEGDTGLNTGGMGAVSPVPFVDEQLMLKVRKRIIEPTIRGIRSRKMDYKGFIFFGLILVDGNPFVIEYNCRLGDPETEVILPRVKSDLIELLKSIFNGTLKETAVEFHPETIATIMLVSDGYPGSYETGKVISGLDEVRESIVFHAGTRLNKGITVTAGGRVLAVSSKGKSIREAINKSLENIGKIHFEGKQFRSDIGFDL